MILVICHGNKYRSVVCEAILRDHGIKVKSAGFRPSGSLAAKPVRLFLSSLGLDVSEHRSRKVTRAMLDEATAIIYMDKGNLRRLKDIDVKYEDKSICLAIYVDKDKIPDPAFITDPTQFRKAMEELVLASRYLANDILWRQRHESECDSSDI